MSYNKIAILVGGSDLFSGIRGISKGTRTIEKKIRPLFDEVIVVNYNYFLDFGRTLRTLHRRFLEEEADPVIFLYGYSKGGEVVLKLSRLLEKTHAIQLLLTVDIANGPWSAGINRSVPSNVKKNINVYQSKPKPPLFSYGLPACSDHPVVIDNIDLTGSKINNTIITHSNIEVLMTDEVIRWMHTEVAGWIPA